MKKRISILLAAFAIAVSTLGNYTQPAEAATKKVYSTTRGSKKVELTIDNPLNPVYREKWLAGAPEVTHRYNESGDTCTLDKSYSNSIAIGIGATAGWDIPMVCSVEISANMTYTVTGTVSAGVSKTVPTKAKSGSYAPMIRYPGHSTHLKQYKNGKLDKTKNFAWQPENRFSYDLKWRSY